MIPKELADTITGAFNIGAQEAYERCAKICEEAWKVPFVTAHKESGELAALRIRDAIRQKAREELK
jgi:hypothetical protein